MSDGAPLAAFIAVVAEPHVATRAVTLELAQADGDTVATYTFVRGQRVEFFEGVDAADEYVVRLNQRPCTGSLDLLEGLETNVSVRIDGANCSAEVTSRDSDPHETAYVSGRVIGAALDGLTVELEPIAGSVGLPRVVRIDEDGYFSISPVTPGDYRLAVRQGTVTLHERSILVVDGELTDTVIELPQHPVGSQPA